MMRNSKKPAIPAKYRKSQGERSRARRVLRFEHYENRRLMAADLGTFLTNGHVDMEISRADSAWKLELSDQTGANVVKYPTSDAMIYAGTPATTTRPQSSTFNFTGVPAGGTLYVLPQQFSDSLPYLGVSAPGLGTSVDRYNPSTESKGRVSGLARWAKMSLVDVRHKNLDGSEGDGVFSVWQVGVFGNVNVLMSSYNDAIQNGNANGFDATDGISNDDALWMISGGHDHYNHGFSKPGRYEVNVKLSAYFNDDGLSTPNSSGFSESSVFTLYFSVLSVGKLELETTNKEIAENAGAITVDVIRTGGSAGKISVQYATVNESALANSDYSHVSGQLVFLDGETRKSIQVPILADSDSEPDEFFQLLLSQPTPESLSNYLRDYESSPFGLLGNVRSTQIKILENQFNHPPSDINLSSSSVTENNPTNIPIGNFTTVDPDAGNTFTYSLVQGSGDIDNASFAIEANTLRLLISTDFESKSSYSIRVRSTDQDGLFTEKTFSIQVIDSDENAYVTGSPAGDAFVASYVGTGTSALWTLTRNSASVFSNRLIPNGGALLIDGLGGSDTLQVNGRTVDDSLRLVGSLLVINGAPLQFSNTEIVRILPGLGNDSLMIEQTPSAGVALTYDGGTGTDILEYSSGENLWNLTGTGTGTVNNAVSFLGTESLRGGTGNDHFIFANAGRLTGALHGGGGQDTLNLSAKTTAHTINLQTNTATSTGGISGIENFIGGTLSNITDILIGPNSATAWIINSTNAGSLSSPTIGTVTFSGFDSLTGGTAADSFIVTNTGSISKTLTGGTATGVIDTLDLSAKSSSLDFRIDTTTNSIPGSVGAYTGFEQVTGNAFADTKVTRVNNTTTAWAITPTGQIAVNGVSYANVLNVVGGPGVDTLTGPALANSAITAWTLNSAGSGSLVIPGASIAFSGMNNLTGNTGADSFEILPTGSLPGAINGGTGTGLNSISYAQWSSNVLVNLALSTAANATAIAGVTSNIQLVIGGAGNDTLQGQTSKATILVGLGGNDNLTGGSQRDLLFGGTGADVLLGSGADDLLVSGSSSHDTNRQALFAIYSEWTSTRSFAIRTANIWGNGTGTNANGDFRLNSDPNDSTTDTVFADNEVDGLTGGLNQDWFFASINDTEDFIGTGTAPDRLNR